MERVACFEGLGIESWEIQKSVILFVLRLSLRLPFQVCVGGGGSSECITLNSSSSVPVTNLVKA